MKKKFENNNNIDLAGLESLKQQVSDMKRKLVEANTDKAWAVNEAAKTLERERQTALERDKALKLVTQQEMDMALNQSELEKALRHISDPSFVFGKESPKEEKVAKCWTLKIIQLILELLGAGTPPNSIGGSIVSSIKNIPPNIELKELPSIWFIRC